MRRDESGRVAVDSLGDWDFLDFARLLLREQLSADGASWQLLQDLRDDCRRARVSDDQDARRRVADAIDARYAIVTHVTATPICPDATRSESGRDERQAAVAAHARAAFSVEDATSLPQRGLRLLEEAAEAYQACGGSESLARRVVGHVFARPPGKVDEELGDVGVTVLALAAAAGLSADREEHLGVLRIYRRTIPEWAERDRVKKAAGITEVSAAAGASVVSDSGDDATDTRESGDLDDSRRRRGP